MILWYFNHKPGGLIWAIFFTVRNTNLDYRTAVTDLFSVANVGLNTRRIVRYNANTLNTPYQSGMTSDIDSGLAIITMGSNNYGSIVCIPEGGTVTAPCICKKTNTWGRWYRVIMDLDVQAGRVESIDCAGNSLTLYDVTFPAPFIKTPQVIVGLYSNTTTSNYGNISTMATMITTTGFRIKVANANSGSFAPGVSWIAFTQ